MIVKFGFCLPFGKPSEDNMDGFSGFPNNSQNNKSESTN